LDNDPLHDPFHIGALAALFVFRRKALLFVLALWWIAAGLGIGMGYHRLLTHRAYRTPKWMEYVLTGCGSLALEGGPIFWVATHRKHQQNADEDGDPISRMMAAFWAHMGWILMGQTVAWDVKVHKLSSHEDRKATTSKDLPT
jgi:fatty-acid desaturase